MTRCTLCQIPTKTIVNINLKAVLVCDECCLTITKQTVQQLSVEAWLYQGEEIAHTRIVSEQL